MEGPGDRIKTTAKMPPSRHPAGQSYGSPNEISIGFADIRQVQHLFFVNNRAGLPASPFAAVHGKLIFEEDDLEKVAALKAPQNTLVTRTPIIQSCR